MARLRGAVPYAVLAALCLLLYLPGIAAIPPLDRDEARFAEASRQMLASGDFLRIRFQDEARNRKPAGIYWLQAGAAALAGTRTGSAIWPYRLPSLVGASLAVLLIFALGRRLMDKGAAFAAAVLTGCALATVAEAHIAKTDAALLAATAAGQLTLGLAYRRHRAGAAMPGLAAAGFWAAETAAILLKGPVAPGLALLTAAAVSLADRDWRWLKGLRPALGLAGMAAVVTPWLVAIEMATSGRFLAQSLGGDFAAKFVGGQESHGAPPLYYTVLSLVTFWPGSLVLVPALVRAWRRRAEPVERFLLCWLVPAWIALELVPTKLPHYALPLYPALALLAGLALAEGTGFRAGSWPHRADLAVRLLWLLTSLALAAALAIGPHFLGAPLAASGIAGAILLAIVAAIALQQRTIGPLAAASAIFAVAVATILPGLDRLWLSRSAAALVAAHPPPAGAQLFAVGDGEPSLVFLLGRGLRFAVAEAAAAQIAPGGEALVAAGDAAAFGHGLAARGLKARPLGQVSGLDYSNGKAMVLTLYVAEPG